jgi:hypothetical protein
MSRRFRPSSLLLLLASVLAWVFLLLYMQMSLDSMRVATNENHDVSSPPPQSLISMVRLLSVAQRHVKKDKNAVMVSCTVATDVRGNLGPASVLLTNGTDWIKDRWQAASDMHGTNIQGSHWVQLTWTATAAAAATATVPQNVAITRIVLDWEAAYADHYDLQIQLSNQTWHSIVQSPLHLVQPHTLEQNVVPTHATPTIRVATAGQSPGVTSVTPLHVIHDIALPHSQLLSLTSSLRLMIYESATGWGVSLWQIQVYGWY